MENTLNVEKVLKFCRLIMEQLETNFRSSFSVLDSLILPKKPSHTTVPLKAGADS
jgi:hypothetical protein